MGDVSANANALREERIVLLHAIADACTSEKVPVKALGGVAVMLRAPHAPVAVRRIPGDLDVAVPQGAHRALERALGAAGMQPQRDFNLQRGTRRQIWWAEDAKGHVDVFLGRFDMCHALDLEPNFASDHPAISATDLLLTKLQVVQMSDKDVRDIVALLATHEIGGTAVGDHIDDRRVADILGDDWGYYTTVSDNLVRLPEAAGRFGDELREVASTQGERLLGVLKGATKTRRFRARARIGRRKRWYRLPEETLEEDALDC